MFTLSHTRRKHHETVVEGEAFDLTNQDESLDGRFSLL